MFRYSLLNLKYINLLPIRTHNICFKEKELFIEFHNLQYCYSSYITTIRIKVYTIIYKQIHQLNEI